MNLTLVKNNCATCAATPHCENNAHFGMGIPATHYAYASGDGCTVPALAMYICDEHVPNLADTLAHHESQGTTLVALHVYRIAADRNWKEWPLVADYTRP
jgi:hypothetical protein